MLNVYKNTADGVETCTIDEDGIWIDLTKPTTEELEYVIAKTGVLPGLLTAALDPEESSRIDVEENQILIIVNAGIESNNNFDTFITIPVGIIVVNSCIITISLEEISGLNLFKIIGNQNVSLDKHTQFALKIIYQVTAMYLDTLNMIYQKTDEIESALYLKMEDDLFVKLLQIEKTLVYFRNSLRSNKNVVEKMFRSQYFPFYEEDNYLLDDINIELLQAMEMVDTSTAIIRSIRDGISSLMSNKLNITMKTLAAITIIMTIPTMVFSFYGMNVNLGNTTGEFTALIIIAFTALITLIAYIIMKICKFF
ncbi:magnesium transporter CorA family protein [Mollicutes bacterium LVI A0039]|nr:magnesium transporter CorA family protein [Mollicutes bacterium LVI A0039]